MAVLGLAVFLVAFPVWITVDAWRFPRSAWQVAGHRRWIWRALPVSLVGSAFLPFGVWWFRSLVLAADGSCIPYLVKVRPMLRLAGLMETEPRRRRAGRLAPPIRIEAQAPQPAKRNLSSWLNPYDEILVGYNRNQPRVVAVNRRGEEYVLFAKPTWEETLEARDRVSDDLLRMGLDRWRRFYGAPSDFLD